MTTFIYNEAYKSGGHWHIAEGLVLQMVPEKSEQRTQDVVDFHGGVPKSQAIEGQSYYEPRSYHKEPGACTRCGKPESDRVHKGISLDRWSYTHAFEEPRVYPILGYVTATIVTPAHKIASAKAACGSVGNIKVTNLKQRDVYRSMTAKKNVGKHLTIAHLVTRLMVETDFVPEPLCAHCWAKLENGYAVG